MDQRVAHPTGDAVADNTRDDRGSTEHALLSDLLRRPRAAMRFPAELEAAFRVWHAQTNAERFRAAILYVLVLYIALGLGIMAVVPKASLGYWPLGYASMTAVILTGLVFSRINALDRWQQHYVTALAFVGMAVLVTIPWLSDGPKMVLASSIGIIHACVVVGAVLGLTFVPAIIAMWGGGFLAIAIQSLLGVEHDWLMLHQTLTAGCGIGTLLAWLMERNSRRVFLQESLLALEKQRSDKLAERMQQMSREDGLTGLANRRYFDEMLQREWQRCMRDSSALSLMFIDVDHFKIFNDHYGHQRGDECLAAMGAVLADHARRPGDLAARYGGEEFVVLYPQTNREAVAQMATELCQAVRDLEMIHEKSPTADHVTVSVGVATRVPDGKLEPEELVASADEALYRAKKAGRNQVARGSD
jgi:diguanylate cyclase (GGDEF)-like protein